MGSDHRAVHKVHRPVELTYKVCLALEFRPDVGGNRLQEIFSVDSDSPYRVERALHQHYDRARLKEFREWFDLPVSQEPQLIADMQRFAADSPKALHSGLPEREDEFAWLREPIAEAVAASQMTEGALAAWANVPVSYLRSVLEGRVRLTYPRVQKIADRLNIELVAVDAPGVHAGIHGRCLRRADAWLE